MLSYIVLYLTLSWRVTHFSVIEDWNINMHALPRDMYARYPRCLLTFIARREMVEMFALNSLICINPLEADHYYDPQYTISDKEKNI